MLTNGTYELESIGVVRELSPTSQLLLIKFMHIEKPVYMFGVYDEFVGHIGQQVIVEFREEFIEGQVELAINNLTIVNQVTGIERSHTLKLYTDHEYEIGSNVIFKNIAEGEVVPKAVVLCKLVEKESSARASWVKLTVLDKNRNIGYIRVFDADNESKELEGKYIKCAIRKTQFGFNATDVYVQSDMSVSANPKVKIARGFIEDIVNKDEVLYDYITKFNLLDKIELYNYEEGEEQGILLVRLAMELSFIQEMTNLTNEIDIEFLIRLAVASKSYTVSNPEVTTYSNKMQTIMAITSHSIARDRKLLVAMDDKVDSPLKVIEREIYENVTNLAKSLVKINGPDNYISLLEGVVK